MDKTIAWLDREEGEILNTKHYAIFCFDTRISEDKALTAYDIQIESEILYFNSNFSRLRWIIFYDMSGKGDMQHIEKYQEDLLKAEFKQTLLHS